MKLWLTLLPLIAPNAVVKNCLNAEAFITETLTKPTIRVGCFVSKKYLFLKVKV